MHGMPLSVRRPFLVVVALAVAAGCSNPVGEDKLPPPAPDQITYAPSLNITLSQFTKNADGVYTQDQVPGTGAVIAAGDSVAVGYTGWLASGTQFDTNQPAGTPLRFKVGAGTVIKGFGSGVTGMRVGGTRRIIIPSELAYGRAGSPPNIPSNAVLIFSIIMSQKF